MNIVEIYEKFPKQSDCIEFLETIKWENQPTCPYCSSKQHTSRKDGKYNMNRYHCNTCNTDYTVLIGTIFQNTKLQLQKWFLAICLILNGEKGISSRQLSRDLKVTKDTACLIQLRVREVMKQNHELLLDIVEMGETCINGKQRKNKIS
ncbi:MAG: transposase [Desulfuromonadales bacterium]|nr:transposase [Desulfuromonadales bacterium]